MTSHRAAIRAAAEQHARYQRELQAAHYRLRQREMWSYAGLVMYGLAAPVASVVLWSVLLPPDHLPWAWPALGWPLSIATWIYLLRLRKYALRRLRQFFDQRRSPVS